MDAHSDVVKATVWLTDDSGGPLHDGRAVEYVVTISHGRPQSYQRTVYQDGTVMTTESSKNTGDVPEHVREQVNKHMMPRGAW